MIAKKYFVGLILLLVTIVACQASGTELVAYYSFDDSSNLTNDDSGNGHHLSVFDGYGTPTYDSSGSVDGASSFDGSTQGWITSTNIFPAGSFSFATWVKADGASGMVVQPWSLSSGFVVSIAGDYRFWTYNDSGYDYVRGIVPASIGSWEHIAMTYEATSGPDETGTYTGTMKAYINGGLVATLEGAQYNADSWNNLAIGRRATLAFNGLIDESAVFSGALTDDEVAALALKLAKPDNVIGYQIPEVWPVAYYSFDDSSNLINDDSGHGHHLSVFSGYGTPTYDSSGKVGGASSFDGSTQGWVTSTNIFPTGSFSFATWVKADGTSGMVIQPWSLSSGFVVTIAGDYRFWTYNDSGYDYVRGYVSSIIDSWQHIAMTYEATSGPDGTGTYAGTLKGYINGSLVATLEGAQYNADSWNNLAIGRRSTLAFNGLIDDCAIWATVLSLEQISGLVTGDYGPMGILSSEAFNVADLNKDGSVNIIDFADFATNWLKTTY